MNAPALLGKFVTKFVVRRLPVFNDKSAKLLSLGGDNLKYKFVENSEKVTGYRIMNLDILQKEIVNISLHTCACEEAQKIVKDGREPIVIKSELNRSGLFSVILVVCKGCDKQFPIKVKNYKKGQN